MEAIALHVASTFGGAQFYISCGQVEVVNGGSGTPGPTVAIPGVYTGYEPGILININYPIPTNYTQPGPVSLLNTVVQPLLLTAFDLVRLFGPDKYSLAELRRVLRQWYTSE